MPYRDAEDAVDHRYLALRTELVELSGRVTELPYLKWKQKEVAATVTAMRVQQSSRMRSRLPMLAKMKIANPCNVVWEKLDGDDRVRSCQMCSKNIYDFSAMRRPRSKRSSSKKKETSARVFINARTAPSSRAAIAATSPI